MQWWYEWGSGRFPPIFFFPFPFPADAVKWQNFFAHTKSLGACAEAVDLRPSIFVKGSRMSQRTEQKLPHYLPIRN